MITAGNKSKRTQGGKRAQAAGHRTVTAREVMTVDPVCVEPSTSIRDLARVFEDHEVSGAPVVDQRGVLVGVVSKTDLIRRCLEGTDEVSPAYLFEILSEQGAGDEFEAAEEVMPESLLCVEDLMTEDPLTASPDDAIEPIAQRMCEAHIHRVIVVDEENIPLGIITSLDLLGALAQQG